MATQSSFRYRLDGTVALTFILVGALSFFIFAFRFKASKACYPISFRKDSVFFQDDPISLEVFTKDAQSFAWDFGDGTPAESSTSPTNIHMYRQTGRYTVKITVNGKCEEWKEVRIVARPIEMNRRPVVMQGPDTAVVNVPVTFTDNTSGATAWEWRFGETDEIDNTNRVATYIFREAGPKEIYLKVNGRNDMTTSRMIYVKDDPRLKEKKDNVKPVNKNKPTVRPPFNLKDSPTIKRNDPVEVKKEEVPSISNDDLEEQLKQVASGRKTAGDFSRYLCDLNMEVFYNKKKMTFAGMCEEIRKKVEDKNYVKSIHVIQTKIDHGCITFLNVTLDKYGLLKRTFIKKSKD